MGHRSGTLEQIFAVDTLELHAVDTLELHAVDALELHAHACRPAAA